MSSKELQALVFINAKHPHNQMNKAIEQHGKDVINSLISKQYINVLDKKTKYLYLLSSGEIILDRFNKIAELID